MYSINQDTLFNYIYKHNFFDGPTFPSLKLLGTSREEGLNCKFNIVNNVDQKNP